MLYRGFVGATANPVRIVISALTMVLFAALCVGSLAGLLFLMATVDRWVLGRLPTGVALSNGGVALIGAALSGWLAWRTLGHLRKRGLRKLANET